MAYEEKNHPGGAPQLAHNLILEGRKRLNISGVEEVESFNEEGVVVHTSRGLLIIRGTELHVEKLSLDGGDLSIEGQVDSLRYEDNTNEKGGFLSRLFK